MAPTLTIGMSQHHLGFTGSVTLRPSTLIAVVGDVVQSLLRHGFERFLFINGHGGNVATVTAAFDEIYPAVSLRGDTSPVRCKMEFWSPGPRCKALEAELYGDSNGSHATAARCRWRNSISHTRSSTRRCRRKSRRAALGSSTAPITGGGFPTVVSDPTLRCPHPSMASVSMPPPSRTWSSFIGAFMAA